MKILIINDYSETVGGTEKYVLNLTAQLRKEGHDVISYFGSHNFQKSVNERKKLKSYIGRIFNLKHYIAVKKIILSEKPDVIHLHNIFNEITPSVLLLARRIPVIMTLHDYAIIQAVTSPYIRNGKNCEKEMCPGCLNCVGLKGSIYEKIKRIIHKPILSQIDVFISPSKSMKKTFEKNSNYKTTQIYNGFVLFKPQPILKGSKNALYSGRLTEEKGIVYLIEAVPEIIESLPKFHLDIVGDGKLLDTLKKKVQKLHLDKHISFIGHLNEDEVIKYYKYSSVLIVPSVWPDNLPTVCIEALSVGRPVIASDVGGIPEIVTNGVSGILIPPKNAKELSISVVNLLSNQEMMETYSVNAVKFVKKFDIEIHSKKILQIYEKLLIKSKLYAA